MPYSGEWYIPLRVIMARFEGRVTLDELYGYGDFLVQMLTEAQTHTPGETVYLLLDASRCDSIPPMYLMAPKGLATLRFTNRGPAFLVTRSRIVRSIIELTAYIANFQVRVFEEITDAINALETEMAKSELP